MPNDVRLPVHQAKEKGRNRVVVETEARQK